MKFITDENLGIQIPKFLKSLGYDVISVIEVALSHPDSGKDFEGKFTRVRD